MKPYHGHNGLKMDRQKGQQNERQKLHISNFSLSPLSKFREKPEQTIKTNRSWFYCINHHVVSQIPIENIWNLMLEAPMPGETMISPSPLGVQTHTPHPPSQSSSPNRVASSCVIAPFSGPTSPSLCREVDCHGLPWMKQDNLLGGKWWFTQLTTNWLWIKNMI